MNASVIDNFAEAAYFQQLAAVEVARGASTTFGAVNAVAAARTTTTTSGTRKSSSPASTRTRATAQVMLVQNSVGLLHWEYHGADVAMGGAIGRAGVRRSAPRERRYRGPSAGGQVLASAEVAQIGLNEVTAALERLDKSLTPAQGLRLYVDSGLSAPLAQHDKPLETSTRLLLLVHGTFSKGDMYTENLPRAFFDAARTRYSHIVAFDHPTLSISPVLNAIDLENALRQAGLKETVPVDIVCHSRGGLVSGWWIRSTQQSCERLVAVGAPLDGTSLASPFRIRHLLDYFANYANFLSRGFGVAAMFPSFASAFLAGAGGLMSILGGASSALSLLPVADAGIALVPGLHGQSRVLNNAEIARLWKDLAWTKAARKLHCFVVESNFEPKHDAPWWNVTEQLRQLPWLAADGVTDRLFPGANDLVVDTDSMSKYVEVQETLQFAGKDGVHHCAYFNQPKTVETLQRWLNIGVDSFWVHRVTVRSANIGAGVGP